MGYGYKCKCVDCGYMLTAFWGTGWRHPKIYSKIVDEMSEGKWGTEAQQFIKENPNGAIDTEYATYQCEECKGFDVLPDMGLYILNDTYHANEGWKYVEPYDLADNGKKAGRLVHRCKRCQGLMRKLQDFDKKIFAGTVYCPMCGGSLNCEDVLETKTPKK